MIRIGNRPFAGASWTQTLSPLQQSILSQLQASPQTFMYSYDKQLQFELQLRESIIDASRELYYSGVQYAVFEYSRCNPRFWILTRQGGFQLRPDVSPSAAIQDIYRNGSLYAFECATAMMILLYKAVLDVLGTAAFDRLFQNIVLYAWQYDQDLGLTTQQTREFIPGDIVYFKNPDVHPDTLEWQGENAVVMGGGLYYGHGIGITSANAIIAALNANRRPGSMRSAYLMRQATRPNFQYLAQFAGPVRIATGHIGTVHYRWAYAFAR